MKGLVCSAGPLWPIRQTNPGARPHVGANAIGLDISHGRDHSSIVTIETDANAWHPAGDDVFANLNAELAKQWKPIVERKDALPDADHWARIKGKLGELKR